MISMAVTGRARREPRLSPGATIRNGAVDGGRPDIATVDSLRLQEPRRAATCRETDRFVAA